MLISRRERNMSRHTTPSRALNDLVEDARVLMDATANVAERKVAKARKRLAAALERGRAAGEAVMDSSTGVVEENFKEVPGQSGRKSEGC